MLGLFVLIGLGADVVAPWGPYEPDIEHASSPPSLRHWLGTDRIGRDVWARLATGARVSLSVAVVAVGIYTAIGTLLGAIAGYLGGTADSIIMCVTDAVMCFPSFILMITLASVLTPSIVNVMLILGAFGWPGICRLVRGQFLTIRNEDYVLAAVATGVRGRRIMLRQILPNAIGPVFVSATLGLAGTIMAETGLSFLGLGVREPLPSWGTMMTVAMQLPILEYQAWLWLPPALTISLTVLAVNFVGDGLTYALDPRLGRRG